MRILLAFSALVLLAGMARGENWPQFRGPSGDGRAAATMIPRHWSETENVRWKTPIHGRGWSSPVVWDEQIWVTTATEKGDQMFAVAVDRGSGKILHDVRVFEVAKPEPIASINSYASPTPVIEEGRVYVHFGSYGTACLDTRSGKILWQRRDLRCDHLRGPGSSPILFGDRLILSLDGIDVQYLVALDKHTGRTVWKTGRSTDFGTIDGDMRKAYSTPLVAELAGRTMMISSGAKATMAYDPQSGAELWKVRYPGFSNTSRPLAGLGMVFVNTGFGTPELWAVRPGGHGDVTASHVAWRVTKGVPAKPSPLLLGERIFMVNDKGVATWLDAKRGKVVWQERLGGQFSASPIYAAGRIYCFDHDGKTTLFAPAESCTILATCQLDDGCMASPAVVGKTLILRTKSRLLCIAE
jgi:outer membrane protein assembly factor BamB